MRFIAFVANIFWVVFLFRASEQFGQGRFIDIDYSSWKDNMKSFKKHSNSQRHKDAVDLWQNFRATVDKNLQSIAVTISGVSDKEINENRQLQVFLVAKVFHLGTILKA